MLQLITPEIGKQIMTLFEKGLEQKEIGQEISEELPEFKNHSAEMIRSVICSYLVDNMNPDTRRKIAKQHIQTAGEKRMNQLSQKERTDRSSLWWQAAKESTTIEEYQERGKNWVIAQGNVPFSDKEISYLVSLLKNKEFLLQQGPNVWYPDYQKIATKLNKEFHIYISNKGETVRRKENLQKWVSKNKEKLKKFWKEVQESDF